MIITDTEVPLGAFVVMRLALASQKSQLIKPEDVTEVFYGNDIKSDMLFGWGIARQISNDKGVALLVFNPEEEITWPEGFRYTHE